MIPKKIIKESPVLKRTRKKKKSPNGNTSDLEGHYDIDAVSFSDGRIYIGSYGSNETIEVAI